VVLVLYLDGLAVCSRSPSK